MIRVVSRFHSRFHVLWLSFKKAICREFMNVDHFYMWIHLKRCCCCCFFIFYFIQRLNDGLVYTYQDMQLNDHNYIVSCRCVLRTGPT